MESPKNSRNRNPKLDALHEMGLILCLRNPHMKRKLLYRTDSSPGEHLANCLLLSSAGRAPTIEPKEQTNRS